MKEIKSQCSACTRESHQSCEYMQLIYCECWQQWHGQNPAYPSTITHTKKHKERKK